ncbi:MAG: phosphate ABC transporter substrate-binding protein PstS [Bdellovibrionales bacterium RIFOXYC1_FULL_54_43]|nr:MAG: phosphate ABC transporter substrate-binding protein PstS [Bdellovibrionales bacterium RIFOXYC1_FULL_54_43]OFZ80649.1 MAG: phosphate ABC transporter substrate-binding protein PstS [Bdellovibrionales bacterium RIFOXYD1_FULL_55_31]
MKRLVITLNLALFVFLGSFRILGAADPVLINGAGATFPYPLYSKWFSEYRKVVPEAQFNYQSIGSGGGIRQFLEKTVDFGASDAPMTEEQMKKSSIPVLHIPTTMGAVVLTYNLPGAPSLRLSGAVISDIFLGKIARWDDSRITSLNQGVELPGTAILVAHRSDGSGTTAIFTDYLSKISPEWKAKVGAGTAVNWPTGIGGKGNEGVTGIVKQSPGSIGYVELIYAANNRLPFASVRNKRNEYVIPNSKSIMAAAAGTIKAIPDDFRASITDADGKNAYPISGFTYLLVRETLLKPKGPYIQRFLKWAMTDGQNYAEALHYAPLPKALIQKIEAKINGIRFE